MSEENRLREIIANGDSADEWLNHPVYKNVITLLKARYISCFENTKFKETQERDEIWRKMQALTAVSQDMERLIAEGRRANNSLMERIKKKMRIIS